MNQLIELRTAPFISGRALALACAVLGWIPVVCIREVLLGGQPLDEIIQLLVVSALGVFLLGWLTYSWLQHRRYGESVCRLRTFPIVIGAPFELEVECALPLNSDEPIVACLSNKVAHGKTSRLIWQSELRIDPGTVAPRGAGRSAVPVRLWMPERPEGNSGQPATADYGPLWVLELKRKARGIDFHAEFTLPVHDATNPADEEPEAG